MPRSRIAALRRDDSALHAVQLSQGRSRRNARKAWSAAWDDVFPDVKGQVRPAVPRSFRARLESRGVPERDRRRNRPARACDQRPALPRSGGGGPLPPGTRLGALDTAGLTVREAVLNSARFTYVSPAATVSACKEPAEDGTCPEYTTSGTGLVDGGYFENSGLATLSDVIRTLDAEPAKRASSSSSSTTATRASSPARSAAGRRRGERGAARARSDGTFDFTAPIEALLRVRESRGQLELRRVRAEFNCKEGACSTGTCSATTPSARGPGGGPGAGARLVPVAAIGEVDRRARQRGLDALPVPPCRVPGGTRFPKGRPSWARARSRTWSADSVRVGTR